MRADWNGRALRVLREMMKAESEAAHHSPAAAALTPANYTFHRRPGSGAGRVEIGLEPRRQDSRLIVGTLTVTEHGAPVRLEGRLAKSPSFWVKSVAIVKQYELIEGVSLPTAIESIADVKIVGQSGFSMRYRYHEVNGQSVPSPRRSTHEHSFNPSREILALFRANASRKLRRTTTSQFDVRSQLCRACSCFHKGRLSSSLSPNICATLLK